MKGELKMDVNEYLPLRDVVFNTFCLLRSLASAELRLERQSESLSLKGLLL